jgi:hypothetical protein
MKKIVVPVVMLFGLLLTSTIGVGTAAATKPEWAEKSDAMVITPKPAGETGEIRAYINVPEVAIDRSPVIYYLWEILPPIPPD